jgi:hypothetical protein
MKVTHNRSILRRSTTTLQALDHHVPSSTFKKENEGCCPARMVLGFPPAHRGKWIKGSHNALQEGLVPPVGGTALVSGELTRISPGKTYPPLLSDLSH